jgi:hypothetical protein
MKHLAIMAGGLTALISSAASTQSPNDGLGSKVRKFAEVTATARGPKGADKVVFFGRNGSGVFVNGIAVVPMVNAKISAPADAVAVMRTRSKNASKKRSPDAEDLQFAAQFKLPVFIVGAWKKPVVIWEVDSQTDPKKFRTIGPQGSAGSWQSLAK